MRIYFTLIITLFFLFTHLATASVVMTGTRIIYSSQFKEKTIQLRNTGKEPFVVQIQIDDGNKENKNDDGIFITPTIFRMEPNTGQSVRLIFTGTHPIQDRESMFYMNFTQLPVSKMDVRGKSQLVLAITNRVKIFYRPQGIVGQPHDPGQELSLMLDGRKIRVNNPSGYYATVRHASLFIHGEKINLADSVIIAPKSSSEWIPSRPITSLDGALLKLTLVNDYGMDVVTERML